MPSSMVKGKKKEAAWSKAKEAAAKEGKGDNYAYITSIFKSMSGKPKEPASEASDDPRGEAKEPVSEKMREAAKYRLAKGK